MSAPVEQIKHNNKFSNKISFYANKKIELLNQIKAYLIEFDIQNLPNFKRDFQAKREKILNYDSYDDRLDKETGTLIEYYYDLRARMKGIYSVFPCKKQGLKSQLMACEYSRHRLDPVWNYRKSQIIRKTYREYLSDTNLHETHTPIHLVLTVPHKNGLFEGKRFYARQLMQSFNLLRKTDAWKKYVYAGEYGVEIKRSPNSNGLHIHIHSLVFQYKHYSVKEAREAIAQEWELLTGAKMFHWETLYCFKRDAAGNYIKHEKWFKEKDANVFIAKEVRKKHYIDRPDAPVDKEERLNEFISGVLECIKYHFKPGAIEKTDGSFDMPLICEILNNTKGMRLYSRFGAFYKEPKLNFNRLDTVPQTEEELEDEVTATVDGVEENLINPHTGELATKDDYYLAVAFPCKIRHRPKKSPKPFEPYANHEDLFFRIDNNLTLKEAIKLVMMGKVRQCLQYDDWLRYQDCHTDKKLKILFSNFSNN